MKYSIVFTSKSGNTRQLADSVHEVLPQADCVYYGPPSPRGDAELIFVGFWTDRGSCSTELADFLKTVRGRKIFLFGTAGFGGSNDYFEQILDNVKSNLDSSNTLLKTYMCKGKMPMSVRERHAAALAQNPTDEKTKAMLANFDDALLHPNIIDLNMLSAMAQVVLSTIK